MLPQGIEGGAGQVGTREPDGGERGQRELRKIDVVEADDREVLGYVEVLHIGGAQDADGRHVVGANDCCRPGGERLEFVESSDAALERVIALNDPLFLDGDLVLLHRILKIVLASDSGMQLVGSGEKADLAMTESSEMIDGGADAGAVFEDDGAG